MPHGAPGRRGEAARGRFVPTRPGAPFARSTAPGMIPPAEIEKLITQALPDARVAITDLTGTMDHYSVEVVSAGFDGRNPLDRRRLMHAALNGPMGDGRIHALELKTRTPAEAGEAP
jgi:stress-induced morphogen